MNIENYHSYYDDRYIYDNFMISTLMLHPSLSVYIIIITVHHYHHYLIIIAIIIITIITLNYVQYVYMCIYILSSVYRCIDVSIGTIHPSPVSPGGHVWSCGRERFSKVLEGSQIHAMPPLIPGKSCTKAGLSHGRMSPK